MMIVVYVYLSLCNELNRDVDFCIVDRFSCYARIYICQCKSCKKDSRILMQSMINKRLQNWCLFINRCRNRFIILNDLNRHLITNNICECNIIYINMNFLSDISSSSSIYNNIMSKKKIEERKKERKRK